MAIEVLHHLVYQSAATLPMGDKELQALLKQARDWNTQHQLTGVLLYSEHNIMQVLEGPQDEVLYIFNKIERDVRHRNVTKLADGEIQQRNFSQWSMGFKAVAPSDFQHLAGYLNINQPDFLPPNPTQSDASLHSILASFVTDEIIRF
ncbi:BLUF domain-containing protein [Hymenobacter sp. BT188]|uniref:BLUF domain-containing protein n=1 Tax=Hymenobacter sp. BT188 TaxID=2763504 RepID=UPI001651A2C7|nr:BLUF domain-containing protein [Hymenobacter sp. BT188]MBC6607720.1 BLUF domain-containing protein [Hymenobacter sp. BT188]